MPLIAVASLCDEDYLAEWRKELRTTVLTGAPILLGLVVFAVWLVRNAQRRRSAVGRPQAWLDERRAMARHAQGSHEQPLTDGRWLRLEKRRLEIEAIGSLVESAMRLVREGIERHGVRLEVAVLEG